MRRVRFLAEARDEFIAEVAWYEKAQSGLGGRFRKAVEESTSIATAFPLAGSPCVAATRRVMVKGFPFSVVYRSEDTGLVVIAVAHFRREPGYWRNRA